MIFKEEDDDGRERVTEEDIYRYIDIAVILGAKISSSSSKYTGRRTNNPLCLDLKSYRFQKGDIDPALIPSTLHSLIFYVYSVFVK